MRPPRAPRHRWRSAPRLPAAFKRPSRRAPDARCRIVTGGDRVQGPLKSFDQWDDFVKDRYDPNRPKEQFRQHTEKAPDVVQEFYRLNHTHQTRAFVEQKKRE